MSADTLFELFQPDVMKDLNEHTKALNNLTKKLDDLTALSVLGGTQSNAKGNTGHLALPVPYSEILQNFIAAYPQDVTPFYNRSTVLVGAGQTKEIVEPTGTGNVGAIVYTHVMTVDYFSPDVFITHQQDNHPPLINRSPATSTITVLGSFLRPVRSTIRHTVENDTNVDVTFIDNAQVALMSIDFVTNVWTPFMSGQIDVIKAAADAFKAVGV